MCARRGGSFSVMAAARAGQRPAIGRLDDQTAGLLTFSHLAPFAFPRVTVPIHGRGPGESHQWPHQSRSGDARMHYVGQIPPDQGNCPHDVKAPGAQSQETTHLPRGRELRSNRRLDTRRLDRRIFRSGTAHFPVGYVRNDEDSGTKRKRIGRRAAGTASSCVLPRKWGQYTGSCGWRAVNSGSAKGRVEVPRAGHQKAKPGWCRGRCTCRLVAVVVPEDWRCRRVVPDVQPLPPVQVAGFAARPVWILT